LQSIHLNNWISMKDRLIYENRENTHTHNLSGLFF
jgi:hypothetical protein